MKLWAYGFLGAPLAMAALPIYVLAPDYFGRMLALPLEAVGFVFFATRLIDAGFDPWLGGRIEILRQRGYHRFGFGIGVIVISFSFLALWQPPLKLGLHWQMTWMACCLLLVCVTHSAINLAYLAWGARISDSPDVRLKASTWREAAGLAGVLLASVLPPWLWQHSGPTLGMAWFSGIFVLGMAGGTWLLLRTAPAWHSGSSAEWVGWTGLLKVKEMRALMLPYFLNALSVAIPSALALFFIHDHLQETRLAGVLLGIYFVGAILGLPLWQMLGRRYGPLRAWRLGMLLAIGCFVWSSTLSGGQASMFAVICLLSGLALGADLCLPPVLIAHVLPEHLPLAAAYGIFQTLGKMALAVASLSLPILAWLGYRPGVHGHWALLFCYALLPCLLKALAWLFLYSSKTNDTIPFSRSRSAP